MITRNVNSNATQGPSAFDRFELYSRRINSLGCAGFAILAVARAVFTIIAFPVVIASYLAQKVVTIWNESKRSDVKKANGVFSDPIEELIRIRNEQRTTTTTTPISQERAPEQSPPIATQTEVAKKQKVSKKVNKEIKVRLLHNDRLNKDLECWIEEAPKGEKRKKAAENIKLFLYNKKHDKKPSLDLSNLGLSSVPNVFASYQFSCMQELNLKGNQLKEVPKEIFGNLKSLQELNLEGNQIPGLPEKMFEGLKTLEVLNLKGNRFKEVPKEMFGNLGLRDLDLGYNQITELPEKIFANLTELQILSLKKNNLKALPKSFEKLTPSLQVLNVKDNQITNGDLKMIKRSRKNLKVLHDASLYGAVKRFGSRKKVTG